MLIRYPFLTCFCAILALLPNVASADSLKPVRSELASVLGLARVIAEAPNEALLFVKIFAAPVEVAECGGTVKSCPDVRLLITVSNGDLGEQPILFELPTEKGWEFRGWLPRPDGESRVGFKLGTTLPDSNIERTSRARWKPVEYRVWVSEENAFYER